LAFTQAHGKSRTQIIGHSLAELWGLKTFEEIIKGTLDRCFAGHEVNYQAWFEMPSVGVQYYDITCYPYRVGDSQVTHAVVVTRNITRRKQADDAKRKLEAELQQARKIEALATLSGGIAHEFNNALMVVAGNIELLQMTLGDHPEIHKFAQATDESIRRMTNLTQQLLAYARGGDFWLQQVEISDLVRKTLPRISVGIDSRIRIETRLKIDLPTIKADLNQLQKVLSAVIENAAEAIEDIGRICISTSLKQMGPESISAHPGLDPGCYVVLAVEDNGHGMDEATRARIFEPFFSTKFQGRGLGMAAVYGIMKNHRGYIYVDSQLGQGTTVNMLFPTAQTVTLAADLSAAGARMVAKTVLVIEDEEKVLATIQSLVERLGFHVIGASSGQAAIDLTRTYPGEIDLALLDIKLPDMEGGTLYPLIQQVRPCMKVIVCSGYSLGPRVQEILKAGAHGFLQKPFNLKSIEVKINDVLNPSSS
jgi:two-component system cell cycle sensor histidine kinase/response regulator CckA